MQQRCVSVSDIEKCAKRYKQSLNMRMLQSFFEVGTDKGLFDCFRAEAL